MHKFLVYHFEAGYKTTAEDSPSDQEQMESMPPTDAEGPLKQDAFISPDCSITFCTERTGEGQ